MLRCVHLLLAALIALGLGVAGTLADPADARKRSGGDEAAIDRGVAFGRAPGADGRPVVLRMDVHHPQGTRPARGAPAIVWIHGGGFVKGGRGLMRPYARAFAERGYVAVSIDYRLSAVADLTATGRTRPLRLAQHDAQAAVRYLRRHAERLGIDPARIVAGGTSAGAMAALSVALHPDDPGRSGTPGESSRVRAAVAVAGFAPLEPFPAGAPPMLVLHGTDDRILPFSRAEATCRLSRNAGGRCDLVAFAGAGHGLIWDRTDDVTARAARWLARLL